MKIIFRNLVLLITVFMIFIGTIMAQETKKPLLMIFPSVLIKDSKNNSKALIRDNKPLIMICDPRIVNEVSNQIISTNKMDVIIFNIDNPAIQRKLMEKKVNQTIIDNFADENSAYQISKAVDAKYALRMQGSISSRVEIALELTEVNSHDKWASSSGSDITADDGPMVEAARNNAIFNAASSAVSQILISALGQKEMMLVEPAKPVVDEQIINNLTRDVNAEAEKYIVKSEEYLKKKNILGAIQEIRKAIDMQPARIELRQGLAELYQQFGLFDLAIDEYKRAISYEKDNSDLYNNLIKLYISNGKIDEASIFLESYIKLDPSSADAQLNMGDIYWNQSKIEDAERAYLEAEKIDPKNPVVQQKIYKLYYAKKQFGKAYQHQINYRSLLSVNTDENNRYLMISDMIREEITKINADMKENRIDFEKQLKTREDYYKENKNALIQIDSLAELLDKEKIPVEYQDSNAHLVLAISLLTQGYGSMVSYFETEKSYYHNQSLSFIAESEKEMEIYNSKFDKIIQ